MTIEKAQFMLRPLLDHIHAGVGIQEQAQHAIGSEGFALPLLLQDSLRKAIVTRQRAIAKKLSQLHPSGSNDAALATGSHFHLLHGIWKTQISGDAHRL
jgi:hypothetical protein